MMAAQGDRKIQVRIRSWRNGDCWEVEVPALGYRLRRAYGEEPVPEHLDESDPVVLDQAVRIVARLQQALPKVRESGGLPYPGAPWWSSDFRAEWMGEVPEQEIADLLRLPRRGGDGNRAATISR